MNAAAREASRPDHPVSVLIVDDVSDTREMYAFYFRRQGFTVSTALDGRNGLDVAMAQRPDVIVMDLSMPGMDGITVTRTLKRDARLRHIPILILTGYPMRAVQEGALEAGADGFLTKPCLPEDLEQHVRRVLDAGSRRPR
jgi:CheY-like chemotaxis protein